MTSTDLLFWQKVRYDHETGCWIWVGARTPLGYGQVRRDHQTVYAHRYAWELMGHALPVKPFELDHLCRAPFCINHRHLEVVTHRENIQRGSPLGRPRGH